MTATAQPVLRLLGRTSLALALLTAAFYVLPLRAADGDLGLRLLFLAVLAMAVAAVLRAQVRVVRRIDVEPFAAVEALLTALYLIILVFSAVYYAMAVVEGRFVDLTTRTDALYFSVAIMSTVGFGDVHASGDAARGVVTAHMLFDLFFIGTAVRLLAAKSGSRRTRPEAGELTPHG